MTTQLQNVSTYGSWIAYFKELLAAIHNFNIYMSVQNIHFLRPPPPLTSKCVHIKISQMDNLPLKWYKKMG